MNNKLHETMKTLFAIASKYDLETEGFDNVAHMARVILNAEHVLSRNAINRCNGIERYDHKAKMRFASWTDEDDARADKSDNRAQTKVIGALRGFLDPMQMQVAFQGDPRGALITILLLDRETRLAGW